MCDPVTLTLAATAVMMAGQGYSAIQKSKEANYKANIAERNAGLAREQERLSQENTRDKALQHYRQVAQERGQQEANMAANGIDLGFGSAVSIAKATDVIAREDANNIQKAGANEARGFDIEVSNYIGEKRAQKRAAKGALISGAFDMAGTALAGAQQFGDIKARRAGGAG